jgi:excinuclease ABC subunit C
MKAQMNKAAQELQFEKAATVRDQLRAIENIVERQKVISSEYVDSDVIAMARSDGEACVQVFFIRGGKLIGREYFLLEGTAESPDPNVIAEFIKQFYDQSPMVPPQVLLPHELEEAQIIQQWLRKKSNAGQVELLIPEEGQLKDLVNMAAENAAETLTALQAQWQSDRHRQTEALAELQAALEITEPLSRIECYDISNTQGTAAVGSMVVYEQGVPKKQHYRRFNIRNVSGPDDFASMEEVLRRRFKRWSVIQEAEDAPGNKPDPSFALLPELILVDGGKGQLGRAIKVVEQYGLTDQIHIAGLAKQNEELFVRGKSKPIILPRQSQGLYLVQRIRDEAHRFAITSHRNRRTKLGLASRLDAIPGIGPTRRKKLLKHFGSLKGIEQASIEELEAVPGINRKLAEAIKSDLG